MSVSQLPSGRWRAQVHCTTRNQNVSASQVLADGQRSYATRADAKRACDQAREILCAHTPHERGPLGPFIKMSQAAAWAAMNQHLIEELVVERSLPTIRAGGWKVCERALGQVLGLSLPGPRERAMRRTAKQPKRRGPLSVVTHWLYWFYDLHGELLYIGITNSGVKRMEQHGAEKEWWMEVSRVDVEHYATREEAEEAERAAIRRYRPKFNDTHNRGVRADDS